VVSCEEVNERLPEVHVIPPPRLEPGARVAVVAPASPVPRADFAAGAAILGARYRLVHDERIFTRDGFLAGSDEERTAELQRALDDPAIAAIFCARGGYGLTRILDRLDGRSFAAAPKPIVGFSDVTALHAWAGRADVMSVHGPVVTQLAKIPEADVTALWQLLESPAPPPFPAPLTAVVSGRAEARLAGGNLEVLSRLLGTPHAADLHDTILVLEEIGERPYRMDRALTQLIKSGALATVRGVIVGDLVDCGKPDDMPTALGVVIERLTTLGVPVATGAPIGHGGSNCPLPIGARARLDVQADGAALVLLEGAVR
jgi:muramoyltetrapeptide carboxypeptidase